MKCPKCKKGYVNPGFVCLFCGTKPEDAENKSQESLLKNMSLLEFSVFLMVIATLIASLIYFFFFAEMHRELKQIEVEEYGIVP
jgi:hypothetical protein